MLSVTALDTYLALMSCAPRESTMTRISCLILGILCAQCSTHTDPNTAAYWIDRLEDPKTEIEAVRKLGSLGDQSAVPDLLKILESGTEAQPEAAYALGQLGDTSVVPALVARIDYASGTGHDTRTQIKNRTNMNVARALALLKATDVIDKLLLLIDNAEPRTREAVARALGSLRDTHAAKALGEMAENDAEPFLRKVAIEALGEIGADESVPVLVRTMYAEVPGISFYFESSLGLIQIGAKAIALLRTTLERKNEDVEAIRVGGRPIAEGAIEGKAAFVLGHLGAHDAQDAMIGVLNQLYRRYQQREREPVFASVPGAIIEIAYSLGNLGGEKVIPALLTLVKDTEPAIRNAAAEALTMAGAKSASATLMGLGRAGPAAARTSVLLAASRLGGATELEQVLALVKTEADPTVKPLLEGLQKRLQAAKECGADVPCWQAKLLGTEDVVRERAAYELGWLKAQNVAAILLKAAEDESALVRLGALSALGRLGSAGVTRVQLVTMYDTWKQKLEYAAANQELRRLIAKTR